MKLTAKKPFPTSNCNSKCYNLVIIKKFINVTLSKTEWPHYADVWENLDLKQNMLQKKIK